MLLELAVVLAAIHFGIPLSYYWFAKRKWLPMPWNLIIDEGYHPSVSIIVPTYNEAQLIETKLENVHEQEYPRDKMEIIVIDSGSDDGTLRKAEEWARVHKDLKTRLISEPERRGKARALNKALEYAKGDIIVMTDADSLWSSKDTLKNALKWFSDPKVGAVSCLKRPASSGVAGVEESYRAYYNVLRLAESKAYSTPIFHGELAAFRRDLLEIIGGFPTDVGADDSHTATRIAILGYRAITPEDVVVTELVPKRGYGIWRIRRAQHLIQHFTKIIRIRPRMNKVFKVILGVEAFLHIINPWLLIAAIALLIMSLATGNSMALILSIAGVASLIMKQYRTWVVNQFLLIIAILRNTWKKELVWSKQQK